MRARQEPQLFMYGPKKLSAGGDGEPLRRRAAAISQGRGVGEWPGDMRLTGKP